MADPKLYLGKDDLARLIKSFSKYLTCRKVGLQFGSQLYFDMGPMFKRQIKPGVAVSGGSSTLVLEGYDWKIFDGRRDLIADSETVSDEIVKETLGPIFLKTRLEMLRFDQDSKEMFVGFSNNLVIASVALSSGKYIDDNLCLWVVPDGRVLSCDAERGFYSDGSVSDAHAKRYASA
jgi:hypothetical protein